MKGFILVIMMQSNIGGGITSVPTEYKTLAACQREVASVQQQSDQTTPGDPIVRAVCVRKG